MPPWSPLAFVVVFFLCLLLLAVFGVIPHPC